MVETTVSSTSLDICCIYAGLAAADAPKKISGVHKRCWKYIPHLTKTPESAPKPEVQAVQAAWLIKPPLPPKLPKILHWSPGLSCSTVGLFQSFLMICGCLSLVVWFLNMVVFLQLLRFLKVFDPLNSNLMLWN